MSAHSDHTVEYQIRRYEIEPAMLAVFMEMWAASVVPLRLAFGFRFHGAWGIEETNEFVWVMSYSGVEGFAAADAAYYGSDERLALRPDPAVHIVGVMEHSATSALRDDA